MIKTIYITSLERKSIKLHISEKQLRLKVTKYNEDGEVEEVVSNHDEVKTALEKAQNEATNLEG